MVVGMAAALSSDPDAMPFSKCPSRSSHGALGGKTLYEVLREKLF